MRIMFLLLYLVLSATIFIVFKLLLSINRYFLLFTGRLVLITGVKNKIKFSESSYPAIGYLFQRTRDILSSFKLKEERVKYCNATQHVQDNSF